MTNRIRAATFLILGSLLAGHADAASVRQVNAKKKMVSIELEEDETMEKGANVCFFTEAGKKVDCGTVAKVKGTVALVKVENTKKLKKIKAGMVAKVGEKADSGEGEGEEPDTDQSGKRGKNAKEAKVGKSPFESGCSIARP